MRKRTEWRRKPLKTSIWAFRLRKLFIPKRNFVMATSKIQSFNTIDEVEQYRKEVNEACDRRAEFISLCKVADGLSNKPFGYIKECFEAISPELYSSKEGRGIMAKYANTVRKSKNLKTMQSLYESIRKANSSMDADFFATEMVSTPWNVNKKSLAEDAHKLGRVLAEGILFVGKKSEAMLPEENTKLSDAVEFIAEGNKSMDNIVEYSQAVKVIKENALKNTTPVEMSKPKEVSLDELLKKFKDNYSEELSEEEAKAIAKIGAAEDKESVFEEFKEDCRESLSNAKAQFKKDGDEASAERIDGIMEQVNGKKFSKDTVGPDICSLLELSQIFS